MRCSTFAQFAIVQANTAAALTTKLNEELYRLRSKNPQVTFEGLTARIMYEEHEEVPENLQDEYQAIGVGFTCEDCPMFCPQLKADGTPDRRAKIGSCPRSDSGTTFRSSPACEWLYAMIRNGEVKLCLED